MTLTTVSSARRRAVAAVVAIGLAVGIAAVGPTGAAPVGAAVVAPTPTPARAGKPTTMAALGDSISQSTGTGELGQENPKNSWSTGWEVNSVRARLGIPTANAQNLSANGARMGDADSQVLTGRDGAALKTTTQYVTIELGGNDLCRDSVADMTSVATYRAQLREALTAIKSRAPQALVFVMSVPDIYNLWYIRGAPQNGTYHPEPQSDQATGLNGARFYWGQSFFPCQSLLANPDSYSQGDRDRRAAVRQRTLEYNDALEAECGTWLRCRYDGDRLFNMTSNRVSPPYGALLPHGSWAFTDSDISRNEGAGKYLCPVQGTIAGGCGDHFHPSKQGQGKLADAATAASYQWADVTVPTAGMTPLPAAKPDGTFRGPVSVLFSGSDSAGLRGQEVRIHRPNGTVTPWSESIGVHPAVVVNDVGGTYVEVRSLDVNGNQSASKILKVTINRTAPLAPGRPTVTPGSGQALVTWAAGDDGGATITGYDLEVVDPAGSGPVVTRHDATRSRTVAVPNGRVARFRVRAVNSVGPGAWSPASDPIVTPLASIPAYVTWAYDSLARREPTADETATVGAALANGTQTPATVAAGLVDGTTWEAKVSPVVRLYRAYFLRFPEASGLAFWEARHRNGQSIASMSQQFSGTPEFRTLYGSLSNRDFVRQVYLNVLHREPEPAGWDYWETELEEGRFNRGRMMVSYSESAENRSETRTEVLPVVVWWGLLGRVPTVEEHTAASAHLAGGGTVLGLVQQIFATPEWATHVS